MSPKRKRSVVTVEPWPELKNRFYQGKVRSACPDKTSRSLLVTIENLDPSQRHRIHETSLALPVRPGNRAARFLAACGVNVEVGARIDLEQIANRIVGFRPHDSADDGPQFDFKRIADPPATETAPPVAKSSGTERPPGKNAAVPLADQQIPF